MKVWPGSGTKAVLRRKHRWDMPFSCVLEEDRERWKGIRQELGEESEKSFQDMVSPLSISKRLAQNIRIRFGQQKYSFPLFIL